MTTARSTGLAVDEAMQYLFADPDWTFKVGVGCLINGAAFGLLLINVILLPICFCLWSLTSGYILTTAKAKVIDPTSKLPVWGEWLDLLIAGGIWVALSTVHCLFIAVIAIAGLTIGSLTGFANLLAPAFLPWAIILWTLLVVATALVSYLSTYLMINFAVRQNIVSAFAFSEIFGRTCLHPKVWLTAWLIQTGLMSLAVLLPMLTIVGIFTIPSTLFFAQLIGCCLLAHAWHACSQPSPSAQNGSNSNAQPMP